MTVAFGCLNTPAMKLLRTLGWILLLPVLAGAAATGWLLTHEEEIEALVLEAIGSGLQTDAHITDLQLTWWSSFPKISVTLREVWLKGSTGAPDDMLLRAEALHLELDVTQFLRDDFQVESIRVSNADIALKTSENGAWNVAVWSTGQPTKPSDRSFSFALNACTFRDVRLTLDNGTTTALLLDDMRCGFALDDAGAWAVDVAGAARCAQIAGLTFPGALPLTIRASASESAGQDWEVDVEQLTSGDLMLTGKWSQPKGEAGTFTGTFDGLNAQVADAVFPAWNAGGTWDVNHAFSGSLRYADHRFSLAGRAAEADWSWGLLSGRAAASAEVTHAAGTWSVALTDATLSMPGIQATVAVNCPNLATGDWAISAAPVVDLAQIEGLAAWLPEPLSIHSGLLSGQTSATYHPPSSTWRRTTADLSVRGLQITSGDWPATVESARLQIRDANNWTVSGLALQTLGTTFTGAIQGANGDISADLACRQLDIPSTLPDVGDWSGGGSTSGEASMRWTGATLKAEKLRWEEVAEGNLALNNTINLQPGTPENTYALQWTGDMAGGRIHIDGEIDARDPSRWPLRFETRAQHVELQPLFATFRNFDQSTLRHEHLRGQVDWTGDVTMDWDMQAGALAASVQAEAELVWRQVRLDNVEAFQEIAAYLRENRLMAPLVDPDDLAQRLRRIDIPESETAIAIVNGDFMLDPLTIHSSAMDVDIAGGQTWAGALDYTLGFALRDLKNSREDAFGQIEDDGLGHRFFLTIAGTLEDPEYSWDRQAGKEARKTRFDEEKQTLRALFRKNRSASEP